MGAFAEQVVWAHTLSKAHQKRGEHGKPEPASAIGWGARGLELGDALQKAQELYGELELPITPANARQWVYDGLLPKPSKKGRGRGGGIAVYYPDDFPAQAVAAALTLAKGHTRRETALARRVVLEGVPTASDFMQGVTEALVLPLENVTHTLAPPKALALASAIRFYAMAIAYARARWQCDTPHGVVFEARFDTDAEGRETLTFFASLPGCYINPMHRHGSMAKVKELDSAIREGTPEEAEGAMQEPVLLIIGEPRRFFEITWAKHLRHGNAGRLWDFLHRDR